MRAFVILSFCLFLGRVNGQDIKQHGRLRVSPDGHGLVFQDGTPFFWLGDTGWEIFHRLTFEEARVYLDDRAAKGFNVIQAVALGDLGGERAPNRYGQQPLQDAASLTPNELYFSVVDSMIRMALERNLFVGLLPTWGDHVTGDWGKGTILIDSAKAYVYGKWIGTRYKDYPNIIWILGGDCAAFRGNMDFRPVWRQMARGIIEATGHRCLIGYHPLGAASSSQFVHQEAWLDINLMQSGHGEGHDMPCWNMAARDHDLQPVKPTLDAEPNYEDHPVNPWPKWNPDNGYFRAYDVRKQLYRSVFAGGCGVTYGHHAIWQFMSEREVAINYPDRGWVNALNRPGAAEAGYLRRLMESRPMQSRVRDSSLVVGGLGTGGQHIEAFRAVDGSVAMVYLPVGKPVIIDATVLHGKKIKGSWFNPRDASTLEIGVVSADSRMSFNPPAVGGENDWVLVLDARN